MTVADSNILLRILVGDIPEQSAAALKWLEFQSIMSVLVLDVVLVEVLFLLESKRAYGLARKDFLPPLILLLSSQPWRLEPLTTSALTLFGSTRLDYVDCLLAAMQQQGIVGTVATFDKKLQLRVGKEL